MLEICKILWYNDFNIIKKHRCTGWGNTLYTMQGQTPCTTASRQVLSYYTTFFSFFQEGKNNIFIWFSERGLTWVLCVIMLFQRTRRATCPCALFCYNFSEERRIYARLFAAMQFNVATHLPMCKACPCGNLLPQIPHAVFSLRYRRGIFPDDIRLPRKYRAILKMKGRFIWILEKWISRMLSKWFKKS